MPAAFDRCERQGGRIKTVVPKKGIYVHVCYPRGGGSPVHGEIKHTKENEAGK